MKNRTSISYLVIAVMALLMQSCSSSIDIGARWLNPDAQTISPGKVVTLAMGKDMRNNRIVEDAFSLAFEQQGFQSVAASDIMPPNFGDLDSTQVDKAIRDANADALATIRLVDINTEQHWVPGTTYYPPYYGSYYGYYGYYGYGGYSSPGYMDETTKALLETNLFDAHTGQLVWVGQSEIIVAGSTEKLAAKYAGVVVRGMVTDGAIAAK